VALKVLQAWHGAALQQQRLLRFLRSLSRAAGTSEQQRMSEAFETWRHWPGALTHTPVSNTSGILTAVFVLLQVCLCSMVPVQHLTHISMQLGSEMRCASACTAGAGALDAAPAMPGSSQHAWTSVAGSCGTAHWQRGMLWHWLSVRRTPRLTAWLRQMPGVRLLRKLDCQHSGTQHCKQLLDTQTHVEARGVGLPCSVMHSTGQPRVSQSICGAGLRQSMRRRIT
jgi:hypothetical protein